MPRLEFDEVLVRSSGVVQRLRPVGLILHEQGISRQRTGVGVPEAGLFPFLESEGLHHGPPHFCPTRPCRHSFSPFIEEGYFDINLGFWIWAARAGPV